MKSFHALLVAFVMAWLMPFPAHAADPTSLSYFDGNGVVACPNNPDVNADQWQSGVLVRVTNCVQLAIIKTTEVFLERFSDDMAPIVNLFVLLIVIFHGVTMLTSQEEGGVKRDSMLLLIKIGVVFMFANNFGGLTILAFGATEQMQTVLADTLTTTETTNEAHQDTLADPATACQVAAAGAAPSNYISPSGLKLWSQLDCLLGRLLGYGGTYLLPASLFGLMSSMAGTGAIGGIVLLICVATLMSLILFVLRVVYIFLVCYIYVGFLIVLSPLIIPTLLWEKTSYIFELWLRNLATGMIMPAVVFAYLCIVMPILDGVIFDGPKTWTDQYGQTHENGAGGLLYVLGEGDPANADANATAAHRGLAQICSMSSSSFDRSFVQARTGHNSVNINDVFAGDLRNILIPTLSAATDPCDQLQMTSLDFGAGTPGKLWEIGVTMAELLLTAILLSFLMQEIPTIVVGIMGGAQAIGGMAKKPMPGEEKVHGAFQRLKGGVMGGGSKASALSGFLR